MTFDEHLEQMLTLLQREGRVTYRALKRRLEITEDYLADLTAEIIEAKRLAVDEDGKVLVWVGTEAEGETAKRRNGRDNGIGEPEDRRTGDRHPIPNCLHSCPSR